jgi:hypothetical protein
MKWFIKLRKFGNFLLFVCFEAKWEKNEIDYTKDWFNSYLNLSPLYTQNYIVQLFTKHEPKIDIDLIKIKNQNWQFHFLKKD